MQTEPRDGAADPRDEKPIETNAAIDFEQACEFWSLRPIRSPAIQVVHAETWSDSDMRGGPSHMETFDYKPQLTKDHGKLGRRGQSLKLLGSRWKFQPQGESGLWMSELFPYLAQSADRLGVINSMHTDNKNHPQALLGLRIVGRGETVSGESSVGRVWERLGLGCVVSAGRSGDRRLAFSQHGLCGTLWTAKQSHLRRRVVGPRLPNSKSHTSEFRTCHALFSCQRDGILAWKC